MKQLYESYPDLENNLEGLFSDDRTICSIENNALKVHIELINKDILLELSQLERLNNIEFIDGITNFEYLGSFGIRFENYYELAINVIPLYYDFDDHSNDWKSESLRFKIGNTQLEIGPISSLMVLLTETIYSENNAGHTDFKHFASIKMGLDENADYQDIAIKTLYYLNSHYLKPTGSKAEINHLQLPYDVWYIWEEQEKIKERNQKLPRKRNIKRKDFEKSEPLALYNDATFRLGESKFLQMYRVIEFFILRTQIHELKNLRYDDKISEEEILKVLNLRNDLEKVRLLLNRALSKNDKSKLCSYAALHHLIVNDNFDELPGALYQYRNSLVHAKENELIRTTLPNPFDLSQIIHRWNYLIEFIARRCITKYNSKSD